MALTTKHLQCAPVYNAYSANWFRLHLFTDCKSLSNWITKPSVTVDKLILIETQSVEDEFDRTDIKNVVFAGTTKNPEDAFTKFIKSPAIKRFL